MQAFISNTLGKSCNIELANLINKLSLESPLDELL